MPLLVLHTTRFRTLGGLLLGLLAAGCAHHTSRPPTPAKAASERDTLRVLFVGNSLTSSNDLPGMVAALFRAAGDGPPIQIGSVAMADHSLEDHLAEGSAARAIKGSRYDVVILQQGPSALPESRTALLEASRRFAERIRAAGARPALLGVWPSAARGSDLDASIESYRLAAESIGGVLLPGGRAWKAAWQRDPEFPLYSSDRFHPSPLGSYLVGLVIFAELSDRSPVGLPRVFDIHGARFEVSEAEAALAQKVAEAVTATAGH